METDLLQDEERLFELLINPFWLTFGWADVAKNKGAPGIDGVTVEAFQENSDQELSQLAEELASWTYKPLPVKRVEIDKPDGGIRLLGIPCIRDRVVQATLKRILEPRVTPLFSTHSFGFIPNRNQGQAVREAQRIVQTGKEWVVDIDLSKFFDRIHHDRLINRLGKIIKDKRILRLTGMILRSGIMKDGMILPSREGSVQGSPLSPLLSNIVLDELDKELESRGLEFCRFADDCNIFVASHKAAKRIMKSVSQYIECKLKLVVNKEKSQVAKSKGVKFLGLTIVRGRIAISLKSMARAMKKVKELTPRGTHQKLETTMAVINRWYRGWSSYYSLTQFPGQFVEIEAHIRRRLRSRIIDQQKSRRNLFNKLRKRGVSRRMAANAVFTNNKRWALSRSNAVERAYSNKYFVNELKQFIRSGENREHWFNLRRWSCLV
ncbi:group II intron reverse transcriptase/maturase [Teredinibacter franksiae]|uniref:group II intron reverse transcriptase/maturase n=1 Tax=Teredinibacter franksiae TaxID=2761453 RepID=UPI0016296ECA|nr:group II intron reverse transcriptase/maturase [Teredinibacter franksiae]